MNLRIANHDVETLSREGIRAVQERRLVAQVRRLASSNAYYRSLWPDSAADCSSIEEFQATVPFTRKEDLLVEQAKNGTAAITTSGIGRIFSQHLTSGTSGLGQEIHPLTLQD